MKVSRPISPILTIKLVAMATSLERSEKDGQNGENLVKNGPVNPEIICMKCLF